jgi:hypothetical protein
VVADALLAAEDSGCSVASPRSATRDMAYVPLRADGGRLQPEILINA